MAQLMLVNPRKRRKAKRSVTKKRRSPRRHLSAISRKVTRRYRRNPIRKTGMVATFTNGAIGAAGALAVDVAMAKLPIPDNLKTGQMAAITKGFVGIGLGMVVSKVLKKNELGKQLAGGAVTVALYNAGKEMIGPSIGLSGMGDGLLGWDDTGLMGWDDSDDLGYYSAAPTYDGVGEIYDDTSY